MLGEKIRKLRLSLGINQTEFAQRLFVTPAAVSQWENDITKPDTDRLMRMSREFAVPLDYFTDKQYSEAELIKQHLMIELGADMPKTEEAKYISDGIDRMPPKLREQAVNILETIYTEYFNKESNK